MPRNLRFVQCMPIPMVDGCPNNRITVCLKLVELVNDKDILKREAELRVERERAKNRDLVRKKALWYRNRYLVTK